MTAIVFRNGTELQRLVNESRLPALTEHERRSSDIFSKRSEREVANLVESFAAGDVAGSCTPCDAESILNGLNDVHEEVETLGERV